MNPIHRWLPQSWQSALKGAIDWSDRACRERNAFRALQLYPLEAWPACTTRAPGLDAWLAAREHVRHALAWALGTPRDSVHDAPGGKSAGTSERPRYTIEKVVLETLPGLHVAASLYVPKVRPGHVPCVLYLNGHWPSLDGAKTGYQDRYLWYPAHGFALLVLDPLQFGEVPGIHQGTNRLNMWHWLSLGYTPAGIEVWNAMRAIDWLQTRPEIDPTRIGVTGISGGGVMTQYLAALDERVKVAAASCSTYTIADQLRKRLVPGQCDCTFFPNVFGLDFPDVLALVAPRPLLILGGRKDPIFPPSGFRAAYRQAREVYDLYPQSHSDGPRIQLVESGAGHTDPPHFLEATRRWMARWLGMAERISDDAFTEASPPPEAPTALRCLERPPARALNYSVHDAWIRPSRPAVPASRQAWTDRASVVREALRTRVFGWVPGTPPPFAPRKLIGSGGFAGTLARYGRWEIQTEAGVRVALDLVEPRQAGSAHGILVWVRRAADHVGFPDLDELLPLFPEWVVAAVSPRLSERPLPAARCAEIERSAALVGRTVAAMQVWDVLRAAQWVRERVGATQSPVIVYGRGDAALIALVTGVVDEKVGHVVVADPPCSFRTAPPLLTLWRDADVPELGGLIAPRRLTFVPELPPAFEVTRELFKLGGAAESLQVEPSLVEAVMAASEPPAGPGV